MTSCWAWGASIAPWSTVCCNTGTEDVRACTDDVPIVESLCSTEQPDDTANSNNTGQKTLPQEIAAVRDCCQKEPLRIQFL